MWIDRAIKWLLPREEHFFDLLERGAECALRASNILLAACSDVTYAEREQQVKLLRDEEHAADKVIQEVYEALNKTFVTPLDRSDIYELATDIENTVDRMTSTASYIVVHAMEDLPSGSRELAEQIHKACQNLAEAVKLLRSMKRMDEIRKLCEGVHQAEHDGDQVFRTQIGLMYKQEKDAIRLLKHKEFLEGMEYALDVCDDVANALETVVIKNA